MKTHKCIALMNWNPQNHSNEELLFVIAVISTTQYHFTWKYIYKGNFPVITNQPDPFANCACWHIQAPVHLYKLITRHIALNYQCALCLYIYHEHLCFKLDHSHLTFPVHLVTILAMHNMSQHQFTFKNMCVYSIHVIAIMNAFFSLNGANPSGTWSLGLKLPKHSSLRKVNLIQSCQI